MKQFKFSDESRKSWDRYDAFHRKTGPFVEFETGELMIAYDPPNYDRHTYPRYGIELTTTKETHHTFYADKACTQAIPRAWLIQGGQQHIAVDTEQRLATKIGYAFRQRTSQQYLAKHVSSASALWNGANRLPVPINQIVISKPDKDMKRSLPVQLLKDVKATVIAAVRLHGWRQNGSDRFKAKETWADMTIAEVVKEISQRQCDMIDVAFNGFSYPRVEVRQDFIYIK